MEGFLGNQIKPITELRSQLRTKLQREVLSNEEKEQLISQVKDLTNKIEKKWFSIEFIYRELLLQEKHSKKKKYYYSDLLKHQIEFGQPFEIIDGNNLQFSCDNFSKIKNDIENENVIVVSVIGPQSSGKSLLLNYLFGTQFLSSSGRCTRGIYGCLSDLKIKDGKKQQKILLLDTEGIQAAEARDEKFDKRIVFYILCVSHIVLICNKGEMNKQMGEMIKLSTEAISTLREQIVENQSVNIIMNMLSQINEQQLEMAINGLTDTILEMDNGEKLRKVFQINKDNVFMLPFAFDRSGQNELVVNQPSQEFVQKIQPIRQKILNYAQQSDQKSQNMYKIKDWFEFAHDFWIFTERFKGLTEYSTLDQRRQDQKMLDKINKLLEEYFIVQKEQNEQQILKIIDPLLLKYQGIISVKAEQLFVELKKEVSSHHQQFSILISQEFKKFCDDQNFSSTLRDKRLISLQKQIDHYLGEWIEICNKQLQEFSDKKSKFIGEARFQQYINELTNQQEQYNDKEAQKLFNKKWNEIEGEIKKILPSKAQIKEDVFKNIHMQYKNLMPDKYIQDLDQERQIQNSFRLVGNLVLKDFIDQWNYSKFLYYIGYEQRPQFNVILNSQKIQKHYLHLNDLFIHEITGYFYDYQRLIKERFKFKTLYKKLMATIYPSKITFCGLFGAHFAKSEIQKLNIIADTIKKESKYFKINAKPNLIDEIINIHKTLKNFDNNFDIKKQNKAEQILHMYIIYISQHIEQYFEFQNQIQVVCLPDRFFFDNEKFSIKDYQYISFINNDELELIKSSNSQYMNHKTEVVINQQYWNINQSFDRYFMHLKNPSQQQFLLHHQEQLYCGKFFFEKLNWQKIINNIQSIVLQNFLKDGKVNQNNQSVHEWVQYLKQNRNNTASLNFCRVQFMFIKNIVRDIKQIINQIDEELEPYCFKISDIGIRNIQLIGQTFITGISQELEIINQMSPLQLFRKNKKIQKKLFVAKITSNDKDMDESLAKKVSDELSESILSKIKQQQLKIFKDNMKAKKSFFKNINLVKQLEQFGLEKAQCEESQNEDNSDEDIDFDQNFQQTQHSKLLYMEQSLGINLNELVQFYVDPKMLLMQKFEDQWSKLSKEEIKQSRNRFKKEKKFQFSTILDYFTNLRIQLQNRNSNIVSTSLFLPSQDQEIDINNQQKIKQICQKALTLYLVQLISCKINQDSTFQVDDINVIANPQFLLVYPEDIGFDLPQDIVKIFEQVLAGESISNISTFISKVIQILQDNLQREDEITDVELIDDVYQTLKIEFIGCEEHCPLCRRQCDVNHKEVQDDSRVHECIYGHQLQCFGGSRHSVSNKAITTSCNDIKLGDEVHYKGQTLKWPEFIQQFKNWKFETKYQGQDKLIKEKNIKIWNLIGDQICTYYQSVKQIPIQFSKIIPSQAQGLTNISYLFLLDSSGSMADIQRSNNKSKWDNLISCVENFLKKFELDINLKMNSRITIITYHSYAQIECQDSVPCQSLAQKLQFSGGGTNFEKPLDLAKHEIEKTYNQFDKFVVLFMSDGEAPYPQKIINDIVRSVIMNKLEFTAVSYGNRSHNEILESMANQLQGRMKTIIEPEQLGEAFLSLIPQVYDA